MGRPLAILSEGRLTTSQLRAITLLSLGMIEVTLAPVEEEKEKKRFVGGGYVFNGTRRSYPKYEDTLRKRLLQEDEDILAIINTFIECH